MRQSISKTMCLFLLAVPLGAHGAGLSFVTAWGSFGTGSNQFDFGSHGGLAVSDDGRVFVTDGGNARISVFDLSGQFLYQWGTYGSASGQFGGPLSLAIGPTGHVVVSDVVHRPIGGRVQELMLDSTFVRQWSTDPSGLELLNIPQALGVGPDGSIYVGEATYYQVREYSPTGDYILRWGGLGSQPGQMGVPTGIAVDQQGNVYVADAPNSRVQKFAANGTFLSMWGSYGTGGNGKFDSGPIGIALDANGYVYCTDAKSVQIFTQSGTFVDQIGGTIGSGLGQFNQPGAVAVGPNGLVYVLDTANNRIQVFTRPATPTQNSSWGKLKAAYR